MNKEKTLKALHRVIKFDGTSIWRSLTNNMGLKLFSVLVAVFLWSYVIETSPNIMQEKTLSGINVVLGGQAALNDRGFAVLTDLNSIDNVKLRVKVAQSLLSQVTTNNVRVELDLSGISSTGKHVIKAQGSTIYGSVVQVMPEYIELDIDDWDVQSIPINVNMIGDKNKDYWYSAYSSLPYVLVSGPVTHVNMISEANIDVDVSGRNTSYNGLMRYVLLDAQGEEIDAQFDHSPRLANVAVDVYPKRTLDIMIEETGAYVGEVAPGYKIVSVKVEPSSLVAAGDQELLSELSGLTIVPVDVEGKMNTFSTMTKVNVIEGIRLQTNEVTVTVTIEHK